MSREVLGERVRLARFVAGHGWRRFVIKLTANPRYRWRFGLKVPERLLIAPQCLRFGVCLDTGIRSDMLPPVGVGACRPAEGGSRPNES